jgi:hypothetical protein
MAVAELVSDLRRDCCCVADVFDVAFAISLDVRLSLRSLLSRSLRVVCESLHETTVPGVLYAASASAMQIK